MKMKRRVVLFALVVVVTAVSCRSSESGRAGDSYATRSSQGNISFELTPRAAENNRLVIELRANTHGGDLADLDLTKLLTLEAGGKTYQPEAVDQLSGHHASGSVTFRIEGRTERFTVILKPVRGMPEQRFEWP